jgi:hypothetical protein
MKKGLKNKLRMTITMLLMTWILAVPVFSAYASYSAPTKDGLVNIPTASDNKKTLDQLITGDKTTDYDKANWVDYLNKHTGADLNNAKKRNDKKKKEDKESVSDGASKGSWTNGLDNSIYDGDAQKIKKDKDEDKDPGVVEGLLIAFFKSMGDWGYKFFNNIHMTLDTVILGRVGGHGIAMNGYNVALFTFELRPGNPYGVVAAAAYTTMRNIIYILILVIVMGKLAAATYAGGSQRAIQALKDSIGSFALAVVMLTAMPYFVDVFLYIRDVGLYATAVSLGKNVLNMDISSLSLIDMFKENAEQSFMNTAMYVGTLLLNLYFGLQYVGLALSYVVYFFAFPFVCMNMQFDKKALGEWWKSLLFSMVVPISDIMLLFIPLAFSHLGSSQAVHVLQLIICSMLIPTRMQLRGAMGIHTNIGMEMAGIATMMGAMSFARSAIGGTARLAAGIGGGIAGGMRDRSMAKMNQEQAARNENQKVTAWNQYKQQNGYGVQPSADGRGTIPGEKEMPGVNSYAEGVRKLSEMYGVPPEAFGKDAANAAYKDGVGGSGEFGGSGYGGTQSGVDQDLLEKYANTSNFESPEFKNLSPAKKAELYRKRSLQQFGGAAGKALLGAGGMVGGAAVAGMATTFFSPATKLQAMGIGMDAGGSFGGAVGGLAGSALGGKIADKIPGARTEGFGGKDVDRLAQQEMQNYRKEWAQSMYQATMSGINEEEINAMNLQQFQQYMTSDQNSDMEKYMDGVYNSVKEMDASPKEMKEEMSRYCVKHAMELSQPYLDKNVNVKSENMDPKILNELRERNNTALHNYYDKNFAPDVLTSKYGGKYKFD